VDPFEKVSGTLGLSGAADAVLILDKDSKGETARRDLGCQILGPLARHDTPESCQAR
jgi:hypothetical protein